MLSIEEQVVVDTVADWVDREVRPVVRDMEHANTYPEKLIEQMKEMGIYGLAIPEPYGDAPVSTPCYAEVTAELARGWMSLAGAMGGHTVVSSCCCTSALLSRSSGTCRGWPPARSGPRWR